MSKFAYKFSNLYGAVYRQGNLLFTEDGNSVISPVGNRLSHFDLKNNRSCTFPFENRKNIERFAVSPEGVILISVDEDGRALIANLKHGTILHHFNFKDKVYDIKFSPNGRYVAVTNGRRVQVWHAPGRSREFTPLSLYRSYPAQYDSTLCLDWSDDSRFFAVGSRDMSCRVFSVRPIPGFRHVTLAAHRSAVRSCFFSHDSLSVYTVAKDGAVGVWQCSMNLSDMRTHVREWGREKRRKRRTRERQERRKMSSLEGGTDDVEDSSDELGEEKEKLVEEEEEEEEEEVEEEKEEGESSEEGETDDEEDEEEMESLTEQESLSPKRGGRHPRQKLEEKKDRLRRSNVCGWSLAHKHLYPQDYGRITCSAMHKPSHLLITGFTSGVFALYEMPDFNPIHTLSISQHKVSSVAVNSTGEWLVFGCKTLGQLLVWEWQSETYVLKQQSHLYDMNTLAYSPDGQTIATGGDDGKVKLWNTSTGFCFVTFSEHSAAVSTVTFSSSGKVVLSASLDGTVRAFDLTRYRNFRTFASPRPVQFSCLTLDPSGEVVCAGSHDTFEVYVWSMQTGRLLELLTGHEGPVSSVSFCPCRPVLMSGSWDKTARLWDVFESKGGAETFHFNSGVLTLTFRPDGAQLAIACLDAQILFWDIASSTQVGCVEGRHDLEIGRRKTDKITARTLSSSVYFTCLSYTADGHNILAGGRSKYICLYNVPQQILLRKFQISRNLSLDGMQRILSGRKMTEAGAMELISEEEEDDEDEEGGMISDIKLPGVHKGDMSARRTRPEIRVKSIQFSPTGRSWAAVTTEGLLEYTLDTTLVFDPTDLSEEVTPEGTMTVLSERRFSLALVMSLRLGDRDLTTRVIETVPSSDIQLTVQNFPAVHIERFVNFLADRLDHSPHLQFYTLWCTQLLIQHGGLLKKSSMPLMAAINNLQKSIKQRQLDLGQIVDGNKYTLQYILSQAKLSDTATNRPTDTLTKEMM